MKLLIITQKVDLDDPTLGFFHRWIEEFSKNYEKLTVICLQKGKYSLPKNVEVLSLGKESGKSRFKYLYRFYKYIWQERKNYDAVFVHMNPIYVVLGGALWKILDKKVSLWYTHKSVDLKLLVAEKLVNIIFTASKESFRLKSNKVHVMGHGIDTFFFKPAAYSRGDFFKICSVARISPTKNQKTMIEAIETLKRQDFKSKLYIVGGALTKADRLYEKYIKNIVIDKNLSEDVIFCGEILQEKMPEFLQKMDILINLSDTGSLDKAVLEAMACGLKVLVSNEAFGQILNTEYKTSKNILEIAKKIDFLLKSPVDTNLMSYVRLHHDLKVLIQNIFYVQKMD